jgi:hypothetical protein
MPTNSSIILPASESSNTGKLARTQTRTVGAATVHEHFAVVLRNGGEFYRLTMFGSLYNSFSAAAVLFALRWGSSTHAAKIQRIRVKRQLIAGFTAAQEFATTLYRCTGYSTSPSGGTAAVLTSPNCKKDTGSAATRLTSAVITSGGAVTTGTMTLDPHPFAAESIAELAASATIRRGAAEDMVYWDSANADELILRQNEGFVVRNEIAMGAGGSVRPIVEIDWEEILLADVT